MSGIIVSGQPRSGKSSLVKSLKNNDDLLACNVDAKIYSLIKSKKINNGISKKIIIPNLIGKDVFQDSEKELKLQL